MKLELKHLACTSHDIKVYDEVSKIILPMPLRADTFFYLTKNITSDSLLKIILRPLSDLTEEIEHNGEKFVPTVWFRDNHSKFGITIEDMKTLISMFIYTFKSPLSAPYYFIDKLLEWNFDIFGLIENGLAVDINTLKK